MGTKVRQTQKNLNEKVILQVTKALGGISCTKDIYIRDSSQLKHTLRDVEIELGISNTNSYIVISCKKKDEKLYKSLGFKETYYSDEVVMDYEDNSDYGVKSIYLNVEPVDAEYTIHIRL